MTSKTSTAAAPDAGSASPPDHPNDDVIVDDGSGAPADAVPGSLGSFADEADRLAAAMRLLHPDDIAPSLKGLGSEDAKRLAGYLGMAKAPLARQPGLVVRTLRRKDGKVNPDVGFQVVEATINDTIDALGDSSDNPNRAEMDAVLPDIVERHGERAVAVMLTTYVVAQAPCREVFDEIVTTDARFRDLAPADDGIEAGAPTVAARERPQTEASAEARAERKRRRDEEKHARRQQRKEEQARQAALRDARRSKKEEEAAEERARATEEAARRADAERTAAEAAAAAAAEKAERVEAEAVEKPLRTRRAPRLVGTYPRIDTSADLVGCVVTAHVNFDDMTGAKTRPAVVMGVFPDGGVVARPCYSDGGMVSRDWKSVELLAWREAGLEQTTFVSQQEVSVPPEMVGHKIGRLTDSDWNLLV